jgi:putative membrane protein
MADLVLAVLHHLLILSLVGLLAVERVLVRPGLTGSSLGILVKMDAAYGATAGLNPGGGLLPRLLGRQGGGLLS